MLPTLPTTESEIPMRQLLVFQKVTGEIAINPDEISEVQPTQVGWTQITMRNRIVHTVQEPFDTVVHRLRFTSSSGL